ncbi:taurine dioxygenase [Embleya scabrispora]|uniref:Taurine dioxygenase n=1 Tax=Embleya scabrispora TaxID=159449 RepID=A0A1T3NIQ4_9ACTN|nr:TauD/TfdA family dioxygenase [Embleya scabrispora]OPC76727.1 taurine dioxygenase [Embleya scabrispora]
MTITTTTTGTPELRVRPVAGYIGADVDGVDLAADLAPATIAALRTALLAHKVLFFRDQHLGHAEHVAFAGRFGPLIERPRPQNGNGLEAYPQVWTISPQADVDRYGFDHEELYRSRRRSGICGWHTDLTTAANPPALSVLRAETVPDRGGDTHWVNLVTAHDHLSDELKAFAARLRAEHTFFAGYHMFPEDPRDRSILELVNKDPQAAIHPVVRVHPETGEHVLFVNPARVNRIIGLSPAESRHVLDLLFAQATRPEYTVRLRWESGTVAMWDNRATAHQGPGDLAHIGQPRVMHRVTVLGERPTGPDGFVSTAVTGNPFHATDA